MRLSLKLPLALIAAVACGVPGAAPDLVGGWTFDRVTASDDVFDVELDGTDTLACGDTGSLTLDLARITDPLDVVILIDGSSSITSADFGTQLDAVQDLVDTLSVSADGDHVALVQFATTVGLELELSDDASAVGSALANMSQRTGQTNWGDAIKAAEDELDANGRVDVPDVVLLVTDGPPNQPVGFDHPVDVAIDFANDLKNTGAVLYGVGVGTAVDAEDLEDVVSTPTDDFIVTVADHGDLSDSWPEISGGADGPTDVTVTGTLGTDITVDGSVDVDDGTVTTGGGSLSWSVDDGDELDGTARSLSFDYTTSASGTVDVLTDVEVSYDDADGTAQTLTVGDFSVSAAACGSGSLFDFEDASLWSKGSVVSTPITQGTGALAVTANWWTPIKSDPFTGTGLSVSGTLAVDVYLPTSPPNPYWIGDLSMVVDCPTDGVYSAWLGRAAFTGKTLGQYHTFTFPVSPTVRGALASANDCTIEMDLNAPSGGAPFVFDDMRFVP